MPTWTTIIRRMQLQRGSSASSCTLDTTPIQFPGRCPRSLDPRRRLRLQCDGGEWTPGLPSRSWGRQPSPRLFTTDSRLGSQDSAGGCNAGFSGAGEGSAAGGGGSGARGNHLARPSSATCPGSPYSLCGQCLPGQGPRRRRLEQSHLTCPLRARGLRASFPQPWPVPTAARTDFPARLPVPPSPARPEVAMDPRAASGSGVTAEAPG